MNLPNQENSSVTYILATADDAGQRLDNFLIKNLKGVPKSMIYRIIRSGEIRVNKGRVKPSSRIEANDSVRIPPIRRDAITENPAANPSHAALDSVAAAIIHEDSSLLVLNKPSGFAVHGGSGLNYGLIEALRVLRPNAPYLELVHRLDRDTSGCILIAKKRSRLRTLHQLLRANTMDKRYLLLVEGEVSWQTKRVDIALAKNILQSGERMVFADPNGKHALTHFSALAKGNGFSLLEARLETGRTHQIRVHCAASGFPICGDDKYGNRQLNRELDKKGLKRLFLHAFSLSWREADLPNVCYFEAALPDELKKFSADILGKRVDELFATKRN